jgi:hypothetical protein
MPDSETTSSTWPLAPNTGAATSEAEKAESPSRSGTSSRWRETDSSRLRRSSGPGLAGASPPVPVADRRAGAVRARHSGDARVTAKPSRRMAGRASYAGRTASTVAARASQAWIVGSSLQATNTAPIGGATGRRTTAAASASRGAPAWPTDAT